MPFLEWRKFTFFDLKKGVDNGKLAEVLKDVEVTVSTSGNNQLVLGDANGQIYLISRSWKVISFKAYDLKVLLAQQLRNLSLLVTVGEDEPGVNPVIKVWDVSRFEKIRRAVLQSDYEGDTQQPTRASQRLVRARKLAAFNGRLHRWVPYSIQGDITRDRGSRSKLLRDGGASPITGLAFKSMAASVLLFVATDTSVFVYNVTQKDKEHKLILDNIGCAKQCSVLAESVQESQFVIACNNAVYFYTSDGKGPCYAVDGEKVLLEWFRSYLVIVSKTNRPVSVQPSNDTTQQNLAHPHMITVLDIQNKFIVFSSPVNEVKAVFNEWGAFYILDSENNVYHLDEKDLQTKLAVLFKKNLYDFAIRIAKSEQYDSDGLVDIFQQYGDHLYSKGAYSSAIEQYIKTIGKLEPSYVIRKFVDSQHIELLTTYLQAIHKQGHANEDHTTLLLNCFTKLNKNDSLKEFILMKDRDLDFNVDIAIKVCRQGSPEEALMLARKHEKHDWYIKLQIEDHQKYSDVLDYLSNLDFKDAEFFMKKYGSILIQHAPHESTQFLKNLCTDYKPNRPVKTESVLRDTQKADPEDYIHLFLNNSKRLVEFLEYVLHEGCFLSSVVYDTLLEHYLHVWKDLDVGAEKTEYTKKILKLLQNSESKYDKPQALVVCHMHGFSEGVLYLYEEQKLYQQILRFHMSQQDTNSILSCCRRYGQQEPSLWIQALFSCVRDSKIPPSDILPEILTVIAKEQLLSPQLVIETLGTGNSNITLSHALPYILNELKKEQEIINNDTELTNNYQKDIEKLKEQLETLKTGTIVIQGSSYHQHCFQSYSENENECPACHPENKKLLELLKAREYTKDLHENFHSELEKSSDGFSLAAEYFGRGVFNKVKVITDPAIDKPFTLYDKNFQAKKAQPTYGLGAEARIRQVENARSTQSIIPMSEGRMRHQENVYSTSLEANIINFSAPKKVAEAPVKFEGDSKRKNPFEEDYDATKNPFCDEEADSDENNPFKDDYDKNLNPFTS